MYQTRSIVLTHTIEKIFQLQGSNTNVDDLHILKQNIKLKQKTQNMNYMLLLAGALLVQSLNHG